MRKRLLDPKFGGDGGLGTEVRFLFSHIDENSSLSRGVEVDFFHFHNLTTDDNESRYLDLDDNNVSNFHMMDYRITSLLSSFCKLRGRLWRVDLLLTKKNILPYNVSGV